VDLYGSLAETGRGHGTDMGIMLGLIGEAPDTVDPSQIAQMLGRVRDERKLNLWGIQTIAFDPDEAFSYRIRPIAEHPNGMRFQTYDSSGGLVSSERYVSIGGGFIRALDSIETDETTPQHEAVPYPFSTGNELLALC